MRLFRNKKGVSYSSIMAMPDIGFLIIAFFVIWLLIGLHIKTDVETFPVESDLAAIRIIYDSVAYQDPDTGRVYPGIVDLEKMQTFHMEKAYLQPKRYMPLKVAFNSIEAYVDESNFKDNYAARFVEHVGRVNVNKVKLYSIAKEAQQTQDGMLEITITQKEQ